MMTPRQRFAELTAQTRHALEVLGQNGYGPVELAPEARERLAAWGRAPASVQAPTQVSTLPKASAETLEAIRADLGDCQRCKLTHGRKRIVFGEGDPHARLVFVGEGPGGDEDRQGRPFVGAAGQLLTKIINAMHLDRESVYICNIIKCRPPGNRNPEPDEIKACLPFLHRQIAAVGPDFICALGSVAARILLDTDQPISRLRGRFHRFEGIAVMPTFHPAFLLRNPHRKREVWEDVKQLMHAMGLESSP